MQCQGYLRKCIFESCNFSGCHFDRSHFPSSSFDGCKFDYATFERTSVEPEILKSGCPGPENLKMRFARTLRTNYQELGNPEAANEAILIELSATEIHHTRSIAVRGKAEMKSKSRSSGNRLGTGQK